MIQVTEIIDDKPYILTKDCEFSFGYKIITITSGSMVIVKYVEQGVAFCVLPDQEDEYLPINVNHLSLNDAVRLIFHDNFDSVDSDK